MWSSTLALNTVSGVSKEMLPLIASSTVLGGGYKKLTAEEVLEILESCY